MFWNTAPSKMMMSKKKKYNDVMEAPSTRSLGEWEGVSERENSTRSLVMEYRS